MIYIIKKIINRLKKYPEVQYELRADSITVNPNNEDGFPVTLIVNAKEDYTVEYGYWHEEFDNEEQAMNCFGFGLSNECRLKIKKRGNRRIKWTLQFNNDGTWENESTVALIDFRIWRKSEFEFSQNNLINGTTE